MSSEEEFVRWLNRSDKSFEENFSFAIKAWKSSDFPMPSKYEKVIEWLGANIEHLGTKSDVFQDELVNEFLELRCPPGLISLTAKRVFVEGIVKWGKRWKSKEVRKPIEVLYGISELEMMQDLLRTEYDVYAKLLGQLCRSYEKYLKSFDGILIGSESELFAKIMESMKSRAKKAGNLEEFEEKFTEFTIQPLVELIIVFQDKGVKFFDDLAEIERTLFTDYVEKDLLGRILKLPTHVNLLALECAIVNCRGDVHFFKKITKTIFGGLRSGEVTSDPALSLTIASYILEMFRKHNIFLNFPVTPSQTALQYFGVNIANFVTEFQEQYLLEVLYLLCATLRLNPLILEKSVFDITAWMMLAKKTDQEQEIFEEYLVLLMDMFRKLSRAEKFVASLQKSLKEAMKVQKTPQISKKRRTITEPPEAAGGKKLKLEDGQEVRMPASEKSTLYLDVLFREFRQKKDTPSGQQKITKFPFIAFAWPTTSVGVSFSKLIVGLMSKPSLVVWKTLIYALKDLINDVKELDENTLFLFDFYSALLCEYFAGCRLPEQSDKFWNDISSNRELTRDALNAFGHFLLNQEHNNRTMNAFLECCYYVGTFDLLLWYYRPDFMTNENEFVEESKKIHSYLTDEEWVLIQQRIKNFGLVECKFNANRLLLQQLKGKMLFQSKKSIHLQKFLLAPASYDFEQIKLIFSTSDGSSWLLEHLNSKEKQEICELLVQELDYDLLKHFIEDMEALEIVAFELYKKLATAFQESKKAIIRGIDFDASVEVIATSVIEKEEGYAVKKVVVDVAKDVLDLLAKLPIGCCGKERKMVFFALHLALYRDLKAAGEDELASTAFSVLADILHFGQQIEICKYFPIERLVQILPPSHAKELYEYIFSNLRHDVDSAEKFLEIIEQILKDNQSELSDDHVALILLSVDTLTQNTAHKRLKKFLVSILGIFASHVTIFFAAVDGRKSKKDKRFVEKTLPAFVVHANQVLTKAKEADDLDENFRRICKIYIGYSMDCHNPHAIKLIMIALSNKAILHFDQDEIEFVLNSYWKQLNEDLRAAKLDEKTAESVIKIITSNETNEDLLISLKKIGKEIARDDFGYTCRLLALLAKCPFSTIKGAIFNEHFKLITFSMVLRLERDDQNQLTDHEAILSLLDCQKAIAENNRIPMSYDTLDDILAFLMDINIKKLHVSDTNVATFNKLHSSITDLCASLIKHRHLILMDRVPQFVHVFKDLLQAICWYKSDRQKDIALPTEELDNLAELALKLESLMHLVASHSVEVKRVAPYVLTFAINLMVSNKRPTTLYPKIKTHIESICYDLVAVCDHRVGRFILRCSNEASRQVYETLVKDHKKYHKFKGKV